MSKKIFDLIKLEEKRQKSFLSLIASENYASKKILKSNGSVLTNKYAEGYPKARYYGGCEVVDKIEELAKDNLKKLFKVKYVNVQPHSGSQANAAAFLALLKPNDKILGMSLDSGGHLTHGHHVSFSGIIYKSYVYNVDKKNNLINYDEVLEIAKKVKPKLIICGASSYPRTIDFLKFKKIANEVNAYLLADIAHISGLIVANLHNSPIDYCDVITSTTHKTLRGPRGGIIMTNNEEVANLIDKALFPGTQGGPLMNVIASKAICFEDALSKEFIVYQKQILKNMKIFEKEFLKAKIFMTTNGSDNHLLLIDTKKSFGITGKKAEELLFFANIIVNKNNLPFDDEKPTVSSGIRIGTAAMTTIGFKEKQCVMIANIIIDILKNNSIEYSKQKSREIKKLLKESKVNNYV